ncbi:MAG: hypothetical protein IT262_08710 [Saprospiraceae bacterium]|nr:hypothetical protein [Saprospiraceae bacterium]
MRALFLLVLLLSAGSVFAQMPGKSFKNPIVVSNPDSIQFFEKQYVSITGPIVSTKELMREDGVIGYLNMFKAYPDNAFDITIFRKSMAFFAPLEQYQGKRLKITGKVSSFLQKKTGIRRYSIRLSNVKQLEVMD